MRGFVYVFPVCRAWVWSSVGWLYGLTLCLDFGCARVSVKHHDGFSPCQLCLGLAGVCPRMALCMFPLCIGLGLGQVLVGCMG